MICFNLGGGGRGAGGDLKVLTAHDQRFSCRLRSQSPDLPDMTLHQKLVKCKNELFESFEILTLDKPRDNLHILQRRFNSVGRSLRKQLYCEILSLIFFSGVCELSAIWSVKINKKWFPKKERISIQELIFIKFLVN
jgi:hypothetical protein